MKKRTLSVVLLTIMVFTMMPIGVPVLASQTPSDWAVPEVSDANTSGLLTPSAAYDFHRPLTRDEFCELVVRMVEQTKGEPLPVPDSNPFTDDVDPISIHALKAWKYGIITGITNTLFAPENNVERQQLCAMMIRAINGLELDLDKTLLIEGLASLPYNDASKIRDYALEPVKLAYTNDIMHGNELGEFLPANNISSQECVAVIIRSFNRIEASKIDGMSVSELLGTAENRIHIGYAYGDTENGVTRNFTLPLTSSGNTTITWSSSDTNIINIVDGVGVVNAGSAARAVTLKAEIRIKNPNSSTSTTRIKEFKLITSPHTGDRVLLENALEALDIFYNNPGDNAGSVTGRIWLPTRILGLPVTWNSNNPSVISNTGIVAAPSTNETRSVVLTATIRLDSQTRTKTFNLTVTNVEYSRGVTLHGVYFGMSTSQVTKLLGTVRHTIAASSTESWQVYYNYNSSYADFIAVAFSNGKAIAVYSMASNAANQLRNRDGTIMTVAQASSYGGIGATSFTDPGNSSQQYAILIYDSTSVIRTSRSLATDGQEELLYLLINAYRVKNKRSPLEWSDKLGTPARTHSSKEGAGNLKDRVVNGGFDSNKYVGGNTVSGYDETFDVLDLMVSNTSGSSSMRSQLLNNTATMSGVGFYSVRSGSNKAYYNYHTYAIGSAVSITGVSVKQNDTVVSTVNVTPSTSTTVTLTLSPSGFSETYSIESSNTNRMKVLVSSSTTGASITVTGISIGNANIIITGNCSGKVFTIPVSIGSVTYASKLVLSCSVTGTEKELSTSSNITGNDSKGGKYILVMSTNDVLTINASTNSGVMVDWTRTGGTNVTAASVAKDSSSNNAIVTASSNVTGQVIIQARVQTSTNTFISHNITIYVVSVSQQITADPFTVLVGGNTTATVTVGALPSGTGSIPEYKWVSSGNYLSRTPPATESTTATFTGTNAGTSEITFTALWSGAAPSTFLGKIERKINMVVQAAAVPPTGVSITGTGVGPSGNAFAAAINLNNTNNASLQLTAAILPTGASQAVTWNISESSGASLSAATGNSVTVSFTSAGIVQVTATATDTAVSNTVTITVSPPPPEVTGVTISCFPDNDTVFVDSDMTISALAIISPETDTTISRAVKWMLDGPASLTTLGSNDASVKFNGPGVVTITAISAVNESKTARITITVTEYTR